MDAFDLWCWRRLLRVPWTARRSNQSILKEINSDYSLEGPMLKLQYFGHLMRRAGSLEKTLMLGNIEGRRRRGWQRMRWLDAIIDSTDMSLSKVQEIVKDREALGAAVHGVTKNWTWLNDWTTHLLPTLISTSHLTSHISQVRALIRQRKNFFLFFSNYMSPILLSFMYQNFWTVKIHLGIYSILEKITLPKSIVFLSISTWT